MSIIHSDTFVVFPFLRSLSRSRCLPGTPFTRGRSLSSPGYRLIRSLLTSALSSEQGVHSSGIVVFLCPSFTLYISLSSFSTIHWFLYVHSRFVVGINLPRPLAPFRWHPASSVHPQVIVVFFRRPFTHTIFVVLPFGCLHKLGRCLPRMSFAHLRPLPFRSYLHSVLHRCLLPSASNGRP